MWVYRMSSEVNQWTSNQYKFLLWLSLPTWEREPISQQLLAEEMGIREETLSRWKQLPGFDEERLRLIRESIGKEAHEIMGAFLSEAKKGQFQQQKTWLEMMGWYTPKIAPTTPDGQRSYDANSSYKDELLKRLARDDVQE